jgi:quercetin dioxygenase-like cupin family protein
MEFSRRDLAWLLPAIAAAQTQVQTQAQTQAQTAAPQVLPSRAVAFEDLPVRKNGANSSRAMLNGLTHSNFAIEVHQSELAPGEQPHAPHKHVHEELVLLWQGSLEYTVNGVTSKLDAGSYAYAASNDLHGMRNAGDKPARYFVIAFGKDN